MSEAIRRIISEHTGTTRTDLALHVLHILQNAKPVSWDRPRSVAKQANGISAKLGKLAPELEKLRELAEDAPAPVEDGEAAVEALLAVERAISLAERVEHAAKARWEALRAHTGLKQESARPWRADMIALAAAFVFRDLTDNVPGRWSGRPTRYSRMVAALYAHFDVKLTKAQFDEALRRALDEFGRCK